MSHQWMQFWRSIIMSLWIMLYSWLNHNLKTVIFKFLYSDSENFCLTLKKISDFVLIELVQFISEICHMRIAFLMISNNSRNEQVSWKISAWAEIRKNTENHYIKYSYIVFESIQDMNISSQTSKLCFFVKLNHQNHLNLLLQTDHNISFLKLFISTLHSSF